MVTIHSRSSWGARRANGDATLTNLGQDVVLHHTVTAHPSPGLSVAGERKIMRQLEDIGNSRFGSGISYNVLIFPSGRAYQGVSFNRRGTHTGGRNSTVRSICFVGNYETNQPTKAAIETAAQIVAEGRGRWWRQAARVQGHRDYKSTACPGKHVYAKRGQIASGKVTPGGTGGGTTKQYEDPNTKHEVGSRTMGLYDGGTDVRWLQEQLKKLSRYTGGTVDGYYGPALESAVRSYQQSRGLTVDGLAGKDTISALRSGKKQAEKPSIPGKAIPFPYEKGGYIGPQSGPNRSHSGIGNRTTNGRPDREWNKEFVRQLVRRGWNARKGGTYLTKHGNDGKYGPELEALIRDFQRDQGLTVDGLAGRDTWDAAFKNPVT